MTRRVKTDEDRARDDLALAGRKRRRAQQRYDAALAVLKEAEQALKLAGAVEMHAAQHPALADPEAAVPLDDDTINLGAHPDVAPHAFDGVLGTGRGCSSCGADEDAPVHDVREAATA